MMTAAELLWLDECARHGVDASDADRSFVFADKDEGPLRRHLNVIVPVSFACVGDRILLSAYPSVRSEAEAVFEKYRSADALFSAESFSALDAALRPYLSAWGYRGAAFPSRYGVSLLLEDASAVDISHIQQGTVRMTDALRGMKNLTSMKTADCISRGAFAHIVNGEIVCISSVNRVSDMEVCVEIGVECAPGHRRNGYARSCTAALTQMLCGDDKAVLYRHYHTNEASAAVARAVGFEPVGRFFSYTSFAI